MEREAEIDEIKRDLALLHARYALYGRTARILRVFCMVLASLLSLGALVFAVKLFLSDTLYGVFFTCSLLIFAAAMIWLIGSSGVRWIDLASQHARGIYYPAFFNPDGQRRRVRSDAEVLEQQIADRERRLAELGEVVPRLNVD